METAFVIFGSTGDLVKRKIYPALKEISKKKKIKIFAIGRRELSQEDYKKEFVETKEILNLIEYKKINHSDKEAYKKLVEGLKDYKEVIFYLSTPPKMFIEILEGMNGLNLKDKKFKIVFEKPFGHDLTSFLKLNLLVLEVFSEEQIFRVDHYLGKEGILEILKFRKKGEYEKYWNSDCIKSIEIFAKEHIGIEKRAGYYEEMGAIKDMVQNHLLQVLSFVCIDLSLNERKEKELFLSKIKTTKDNFLGQYESYKQEEGVNKNSKTETLAQIKLKVENPRWKNTDFYLITGKKLDKKETKIVINFIEKKGLPKKIIFEISPKERICFEGEKSECKYEKEEIKEAYVNILNGVLDNKKEIFPDEKELEISWKIIHEIKKEKLFIYSDGSNEESILRRE